MTESTEKQGGLQHIGTLLLSPALWPLHVDVSGDNEKRVLFEIKAAIAEHVGLGSEGRDSCNMVFMVPVFAVGQWSVPCHLYFNKMLIGQ